MEEGDAKRFIKKHNKERKTKATSDFVGYVWWSQEHKKDVSMEINKEKSK